MLALSIAWMWRICGITLPYSEIDRLWFVRIEAPRSDFAPDLSGSATQASVRAVHRFALEQTIFQSLTISRIEHWRLRDTGSDIVSDAAALTVDDRFFSTLGLKLSLGLPPNPDSSEIVVTTRFAKIRFGDPRSAIGKVIVLNEIAHRVSGVLTDDFLLPADVGAQRRGESRADLIVAHRLERILAERDERDVSTSLFVVGRSDEARASLRALADAQLSAIGEAMGGARWSARVVALGEHMLGHERRIVTALLLISGFLAFSAFAGVVLMARGRFVGRHANQVIFVRLGAVGRFSTIFEVAEVILVMARSSVTLIGLTGIALWLLTRMPIGQGLLDRGFVIHASLAAFIYLGLVGAGLLMVAVNGAPRAARSGAFSARGSASTRIGRITLRTLVAGQTLVALIALSAMSSLVADAWSAMRAIRQVDVDDVTELLLSFPEGLASGFIEERVAQIQQAIAGFPQVESTAISSAPALELVGNIITYSGPRLPGRVRQRLSDGSVIIESTADASGLAEVTYSIMVSYQQPAFFRILRHRQLSGRVFSDREPGVTLLSASAYRAIFGDRSYRVDLPLPAPPGGSSEWSSALRVTGVVDADAGFDAIPDFVVFNRLPLAFRPWPPDGHAQNIQRVALLLRLHRGQTLTPAQLRPVLESVVDGEVEWRLRDLHAVVDKRLRNYLFGALGSVVLAVFVAISAALGMAGVARLMVDTKRGEFAIRLAVGADRRRVVFEVLRGELAVPLVLACLWMLASVVGHILAAQVHGSAWFSVGDGLVAVGVAIASLVIGVLLGIAGPLRGSPAEILREYDMSG